MQIQVSTDNHVVGSAELTRQVDAVVANALSHFGDRVTRVEVYISTLAKNPPRMTSVVSWRLASPAFNRSWSAIRGRFWTRRSTRLPRSWRKR